MVKRVVEHSGTERYQCRAETDRWQYRHRPAEGTSSLMIKMTLRHYADVGRGHHPDFVMVMMRGLSGFSNHLEIYNTGKT